MWSFDLAPFQAAGRQAPQAIRGEQRRTGDSKSNWRGG
jgi:hypothetical protein